MSRILAVDPGTFEVGLFDGKNGDTLIIGCRKQKTPRPERLANLNETLENFFSLHDQFDFVVYEEQFTRGNKSEVVKSLYGAVGIIEALSIQFGAGVMSCPQGTIKKWLKDEKSLDIKNFSDKKELNREASKIFFPKLKLESQDEIDASVIYQFITERGEIETS